MTITGTPTNLNLNSTNPPAHPDALNVIFQAGAQYPDPNDPTGATQIRDVSADYYPPQVGGVFVLTDDYDLSGPDSGWTLVCNSPTPFTLTFPASAPVLQNGQGIWRVKIINIGLGEVTLDLNGATLDGNTPASPYTGPVLEQFDALSISTDGTDFRSDLDSNGIIGGVVPFTGTSATLDNVVRKKLATFSNGSAVAVTIDAANIGKRWMCWVVNLGAGTVTLALAAVGSPPTAGTINGAANLALTTGQGCALFFDGVNCEAVTGTGGGGGGGTPGGTNHEVQINSSGSFGGLATGTAGQYLRSGGASADPAFASIAESEVTSLVSDLAVKAPLASPALTGTPTAPTAAGGTNTTQLATTAFVQAAVSSTNLVIGFVVNNGAAGSNVGAMLQAPRAGTVSKCVIVTKSSDGTTGLTFRIKKNGTDVFTSDPSVAAGTASGTTSSSTSLTSSPLSVAAGDVFQIDITSGSPNWAFTAQLET